MQRSSTLWHRLTNTDCSEFAFCKSSPVCLTVIASPSLITTCMASGCDLCGHLTIESGHQQVMVLHDQFPAYKLATATPLNRSLAVYSPGNHQCFLVAMRLLS